MPRDYNQVLVPMSTPVLTAPQRTTLFALIEQHGPKLLPIGERIARSDEVTDRDVDSIVGFIGETNLAINGRTEGPAYRELVEIYDAIAREYWGIGRRVDDFDERMRRLDSSESSVRTDAECSAGAQATGTVIAHEAFGMFVDVGWSVFGLVLHGMFPDDPSGPREFPELGSRVLVEVADAAPRKRQIYMRLICREPEFASLGSGTDVK